MSPVLIPPSSRPLWMTKATRSSLRSSFPSDFRWAHTSACTWSWWLSHAARSRVCCPTSPSWAGRSSRLRVDWRFGTRRRAVLRREGGRRHTQTTEAFSTQDLDAIRDVVIDESTAIDLAPIDLNVFDQWRQLDRRLLADPWDRFMVATALAEGVPLVTRDEAISKSKYVETVW